MKTAKSMTELTIEQTARVIGGQGKPKLDLPNPKTDERPKKDW